MTITEDIIEKIRRHRIMNNIPRSIEMNEKDLRQLKFDLEGSVVFIPEDGWKSLIHGKYFGVIILFNPEIKEIIVNK